MLDILALGGVRRQVTESIERIVGDGHALIRLDQHNAFACRGQHRRHMVVCVAHGGEELETLDCDGGLCREEHHGLLVGCARLIVGIVDV